MKLKEITLCTDGACSGNPGPGGYAAIIKYKSNEKVIAGYDPATTNNRMELRALIEAIKVLKSPCDITVLTDSQYVCTGIANAKDWYSRNWRTKTGAKCANYDMWEELTKWKSMGQHVIHYEHVKGHAGHPDNERCDQLAKEQILLHKGELA